MKRVVSKGGVRALINNIGSIAVLSVCAFMIYRGLINKSSDTLWTTIMLIGLACFLLYGIIPFIGLKVEVELSGVKIKNFWSERFISWKEIKAVDAVPTYFGAYHILLEHEDNNKNEFIPTANFGNGKLISKALMEAAYLGKPQVTFNKLAKEIHGNPPFGIFKV